jgi:alkyl sulfatase BDS1-like metallo-beta-lactamase superfamily hydrolase
MGGGDATLDAAKAAHAEGDHQFGAELAQLVVRAEPGNEDAKLVKAAALRARGYQELNPIARSWYLTGALELEGTVDPNMVLAAMMGMLGSEESARNVVSAWRYKLNAEAAGDERLTVGIRVSGTDDEMTVYLRNSVLVVDDGIDADADAIVVASASQLADPSQLDAVSTVSGDPEAFTRLVELLDFEVVGFKMHQR